MNQTRCLHLIAIGFGIAFDVIPSCTAFAIPPRGLLSTTCRGRKTTTTTIPIFTTTRKGYEYRQGVVTKTTRKSSTGTDDDFTFMTSRDRVKIEIASTCVCGSDPNTANKVNQDACFVRPLSSDCPNVYMAGVLDGHGKKGHVLNAFLCERIPQVLEEKLRPYFTVEDKGNEDVQGKDSPLHLPMYLPSETDVELMLVESFEQVNEEARLNTKVPAGRSGTTCVVCIFDARHGTIYTANVGDSRAIIAFEKEQGNDSRGSSDIDPDADIKNEYSYSYEWLVQALSEETTTKREDERKRIESGEGRIDGGGNVWYGPVAIAMTRSLGNVVMRRAGIIPTPEVTTSHLKSSATSLSSFSTGKVVPCYIILGTDGIFDVLKNDDVVDFVDTEYKKTGNLQISSDGLVAEARDRWQAGLSLDVRIDDATCVLVRFDTSHNNKN